MPAVKIPVNDTISFLYLQHATEIVVTLVVLHEENQEVTSRCTSQMLSNAGFDVFFDASLIETFQQNFDFVVIWDAMVVKWRQS